MAPVFEIDAIASWSDGQVLPLVSVRVTCLLLLTLTGAPSTAIWAPIIASPTFETIAIASLLLLARILIISAILIVVVLVALVSLSIEQIHRRIHAEARSSHLLGLLL